MFEEHERSIVTFNSRGGKCINVGGGEDPSYRYHVPLAHAQKITKGAYQETLLPNLEDVTKSLKTFFPDAQLDILIKFLACHFSCSGEKNKGNIPKLSGGFSTDEVCKGLCQYFDLYVLCPKCKKPETRGITNKRGDNIYVACKVCGGGWPLTRQAIAHKFYKTIQKHTKVRNEAYKQYDAAYSAKQKSDAREKYKSGRKKRTKVMGLKAFIGAEDRTDEDILEHLGKLKLSKETRMAEIVQSLFKDCSTVKDVLGVLKKRTEVLKAVTNVSSEDMKALTGFICFAAASKPSTLKTLFATAVAQDLVYVSVIEEWYAEPYGNSLGHKGLSTSAVGSTISKDVLTKCKNACTVLMEHLRELETSSDDESDSGNDDDEKGRPGRVDDDDEK